MSPTSTLYSNSLKHNMAKKRTYRSSQAYSRSSTKKSETTDDVQTDSANLENQSEVEDEVETTSKPSYSSSGRTTSKKKPSNVVEVRYTKGKDNLQLIDKVSNEEIILVPGDERSVHMDKSLVKTLEADGFEFEVM